MMLSLAKRNANAANAQKSTGPLTDAGIARSSQNAFRHGLTATSCVVIDGVEDRAQYEVLLAAILSDLDARGPTETLIAERVAQLFWRLRRVVRFESERLSQSQRSLLPLISELNDTVLARLHRDRTLDALGLLFLPPDHLIDDAAVEKILDACAGVLTDRERVAFDDGVARGRAQFGLHGSVASASAMIREGESALRSIGSEKSNIPALAYAHWAGVNRAWNSSSRAADLGRERQRTEALLLEIEHAAIIERYEPRLRRDLSRTLKDLFDLQERRRARSVTDHLFSQNEPT